MQLAIPVFILLVLACEFLPGLHLALVPKRLRHARASRLAHAQFYEQGVQLTREHSGVLLFVSMAERYVEIVADKGIHEKIGEARWQEIVDGFTAKVASGDVAEGFVDAISGTPFQVPVAASWPWIVKVVLAEDKAARSAIL